MENKNICIESNSPVSLNYKNCSLARKNLSNSCLLNNTYGICSFTSGPYKTKIYYYKFASHSKKTAHSTELRCLSTYTNSHFENIKEDTGEANTP